VFRERVIFPRGAGGSKNWVKGESNALLGPSSTRILGRDGRANRTGKISGSQMFPHVDQKMHTAKRNLVSQRITSRLLHGETSAQRYAARVRKKFQRRGFNSRGEISFLGEECPPEQIVKIAGTHGGRPQRARNHVVFKWASDKKQIPFLSPTHVLWKDPLGKR